MERTPRLGGIELTRGVASFAVCWFHLTNGNLRFLPDGWLKTSGAYGMLGVEAFFVVSGFVIPYTLHAHHFRLRSYWRFVARRLRRLEPPYVASVLMVILLGVISHAMPGFRGSTEPVAIGRVVAHVFHVWPFLGYSALNPVYWTLVIELQFYLLAGLIFPWWDSPQVALRLGSTIGIVALGLLLPDRRLVTFWLPFLALGVCGFQYYAGLSRRAEFITAASSLVLFAGAVIGWREAAAGLAALLVILLAPAGGSSFWLWLGGLSYSLYLVHAPVGSRLINLGERFPESIRPWFLVAAVLASFAAAWALWWAVERPAKTWAARVQYRR